MQTLKASRKGATEIKYVLLSSSDKSQETDKYEPKFKGDPDAVSVFISWESQIRHKSIIDRSFTVHCNEVKNKISNSKKKGLFRDK